MKTWCVRCDYEEDVDLSQLQVPATTYRIAMVCEKCTRKEAEEEV